MSSMIEKQWSTDQLITGITLPNWMRVLKDNEFDVDLAYVHRALWIAGLAAGSSLANLLERPKEAALADYELPQAPLFLLGHWRSGTTHLQNLMGRVPNHTFPTVFQCIFPNSFLTTGSLLPRLMSGLLDDTRTYDNVQQGWHEAAEDEIALAKMTGLSPYIGTMFPKHSAEYEQYVDFQGASQAHRAQFLDALELLIKKISYTSGGKRVVVKSCAHTARIPLILERFPDARFVYIGRNPYRVFASTLHMRSHTDWENFFHLPENVLAKREEETLRLGKRVFDRYAQDRHLISKDRLVEIRYEDLCGNELSTIHSLFDRLDLSDWENSEPALQQYVDSLKGYQVNALSMSDHDKKKVQQWWSTAFKLGNYNM